MDASKDLIEATEMYLQHNTVIGATKISSEAMIRELEACVAAARPSLRSITLASIASQIVFDTHSKLPEGFLHRQALLVYSLGDEAWLNSDAAFWFVARDHAWCWVTCNSAGTDMKYGVGAVEDFVGWLRKAFNSSDTVPIRVLSSVSESIARRFVLAAERSDEQSIIFRNGAAKQREIVDKVNRVKEPRPTI